MTLGRRNCLPAPSPHLHEAFFVNIGHPSFIQANYRRFPYPSIRPLRRHSSDRAKPLDKLFHLCIPCAPDTRYTISDKFSSSRVHMEFGKRMRFDPKLSSHQYWPAVVVAVGRDRGQTRIFSGSSVSG